MSPRGRPRKPNPKIPAHIDQALLPKGLYFNHAGSGWWYVLDGAKKRYVAGAKAPLSELHRIVEGGAHATAGSVDALFDLYFAAEAFTKLQPSTRTSYEYAGDAIKEFRMKDGGRFGAVPAKQLTRPVLQRLVDAMGKGTQRDDAGKLVATPSKARSVARMLAIVTRWGANRGHCTGGIGDKLELPREKADPRVPESVLQQRVVAFARERCARKQGTKGSLAPYVWAVAEIAYLCRLRGIEVCDMTDARANDEGVLCLRRKGSDPNRVEWSPRLREAWDYLVEQRNALWAKRRMPTPIRAEDRPLLVDRFGEALGRRPLTLAWRRLMKLSIEEGIVDKGTRFGLHGLKHRGITDTEGTRADKRQASGHATEAMVKRYDHSVPKVSPAGSSLGKKPEKS